MDSSSEHGKTSLQELKQWSDEEILSFVQHAKRDGEDLQSAWNCTAHPEPLFIDFYDEVMVNIYTEVEKVKLYKRFIDEGLAEEADDDGNNLETLDALLGEFDNLKEDAGEDAGLINESYEPLLQIYMFKWMLMSQQWGDEFLLKFVNDELDN
tara:strand:- start:30 stop:488 length:459 start_codon:yes stop_codon:yes gene_type:complete